MKFSGIVLAGGKSSRMKTDKTGLLLGEKSLLEIQVGKLTELGCDDVIVSGKVVPDIIPDLGPMGGLYSCFPECKHSCAIVMSVDVPLLSKETLHQLLDAHFDKNPDATILSFNGRPEPLIGVYNTAHSALCKELIDNKKLAIRALLERLDCQYYDFHGDPNELINCNSPEDYELIKNIYSQNQ